MVEKSSRMQEGIIKYVMIKIDKFSFHIDFTVLDIKKNSKIPLIIERPFMKTAMMLVDINKDLVEVISLGHAIYFHMRCIF